MRGLFPEDPLIWLLLGLGTILIGISKTGIPGVGILFVAIFANLFPARLSTGIVLPLLIAADFVAVSQFRGKTVWSHVGKLIPPAFIGVVIGYYGLRILNDSNAGFWIGVLILLMVILHFIRKLFPNWTPHRTGVALFFGFTGGMVTMISNAAGPLVTLYLLEMKLKKEEFMGTGAWFFFIMNCVKVPFSLSLGIINLQTLSLNIIFLPILFIGVWIGGLIHRRISQRWFEGVAIVFAAVVAVRLILKNLG